VKIIDSLAEAEAFYQRQVKLGSDTRWDGWDLVFFRPDPRGIHNVGGAFRNGVWGFENRSPLQSDGTWAIDWRNVAKHKRTPRD
jgi:hypothetical protein